MEKELTLVILAAGMGSRFGGLKQIEPVGPNNEFIIDYSVYDAKRAGFNKIVFVIKEENYEIFKNTIGKRVEPHIDVEYAFQRLEDLPSGIKVPEGREKPWGTSHAVLAAKDFVKGNFAIINADDFYGYDAFKTIADFLTKEKEGDKENFCLVAYKIANTMSENGSVKRGICFEKDGYLSRIVESSVERKNNKIIATPLDGSEPFEISEDQYTSMNLLGFTPYIFKHIEDNFLSFIENNKDNLLKCEYLIPDSLFDCSKKGYATIKVLTTNSKWYGVTYKEDKESLTSAINKMIDEGMYPNKLW